MARQGRVRVKKNGKKRGVKPFKHGARRPRRAGHKKRILYRVNEKKGSGAMKRYRRGYRLIWRKAGGYVSQLKHFPRPDSCDKRNHHRGVMPSLPGDFSLTEKQASTILEKVCESPKTSYSQVRTVSATLSYLHAILTGIQGKNWKDVTAVLHAYPEADFKLIRKSLVPTVVPSPSCIRKAFTKGWDPASGVSLTLWCTMLLAGWCTYLWGCRPNCDMNSVKTSTTHVDSEPRGAGLKPPWFDFIVVFC